MEHPPWLFFTNFLIYLWDLFKENGDFFLSFFMIIIAVIG